MTRTLPPFLQHSTVPFVQPPPSYRLFQRIGNALYFAPCPDYPEPTPSLSVALTRLATLKAWHQAQEHGITATADGFVAKSEGRTVAEYQVKEVK